MNSKGFTLVELVVVSAIVMVLMGRTLIAVQDFNNRQGLRDDALTVVEYLRQAHTGAAAGRVGSCTDRFGGNRVSMSEKVLTITQLCSGGDVKTVNLNVGRFCDPIIVDFNILGGEAEETNIKICLKEVQQYGINIMATGSVSEPTQITK